MAGIETLETAKENSCGLMPGPATLETSIPLARGFPTASRASYRNAPDRLSFQ